MAFVRSVCPSLGVWFRFSLVVAAFVLSWVVHFMCVVRLSYIIPVLISAGFIDYVFFFMFFSRAVLISRVVILVFGVYELGCGNPETYLNLF